MIPMENTDPRIDAIYEADPLLKLVGPGTIADVLKAVEAAGLIPMAATITTEYAVGLNRPGLGIQEVTTGTLAAAEAVVDVQPAYSKPHLVSRAVTSFASVTGEWKPVPAQALEESRA
jgi:hypothetical protein